LDRLLIHVAEAISRNLQPTDILGNLGGNDFAVILLGAGAQLARERVAGMVETLARMPLNEQGVAITPVLLGSSAELTAGATAEASIRNADRLRTP
jgi:GGDEF domain-containing protein